MPFAHLLLLIFGCIAALILLISWGKVNAFIAFLVVAIGTGLAAGIPFNSIIDSVQKGVGDTLGSLVIIVALGAMLGKLVAESGAAQQIASRMMRIFGEKYIQWALMATGFIVGIPLFYNVGFVLMVPLIFSVVYQYKLPAVYIGLPMLASLSVTHGFLPPHPSPVNLVKELHANMALTMLFGLIVAIPTVIVAGPIFARTLKNMVSVPLKTFAAKSLSPEFLPSVPNSFLSSLLPVILMGITALTPFFSPEAGLLRDFLKFLGDPAMVMLLALGVATWSLGLHLGKSMQSIMDTYNDAVKDIAVLLLILGGAGGLKQVFIDSGVSREIGLAVQHWPIHPLLLGWLIAAIIRVCIGSATVAGVTAVGIIAPIIDQMSVHPSLMVLSIGAGSLLFSHVNDSGFWMFKEYFNLSLKDTLKSWSVMETIVSVMGLAGVLLLNLFI